MNWTRINITLKDTCTNPAAFSEDIANLLIMSGVDTFTTDDFSDLEEVLSQGGIFYDYIDDDLLKLQKENPIVHAFLTPDDEGEEIARTVYTAIETLKCEKREYASLEWTRDEVRDEDWENNWKEFFKPFPVGNRLYVKPTWEEIDEKTKAERLIIEIDPSSSFGTGTHATTKLCLEHLEKTVQGGEKVLDMGCGSGILSIGALLLGAANCTAVDIDEVAARIAKENIENNGFLSDRCEVLCGNVLEDTLLQEKIGGGYSIICANIVAGIIIEMAPLFFSSLEKNGLLIASGIISERETEVKTALESAGFKVLNTSSEDDWSAILAKKL